jgi:hypothetical protein
MKLTKTNKKIDDNICKALTLACESSLHQFSGFLWLTHRVNYTNFPASLVVTCVFAHDEDIAIMQNQQLDKVLRQTVQTHLLKIGIVLKNIHNTVRFDSEEACLHQHGGEWDNRLALSSVKQNVNAKRLH